MDDITYEHVKDAEDGLSECCGAPAYLGLCSECREHCDVYYEDEDE